jgi:PTS system sucrose-specific IIC component
MPITGVISNALVSVVGAVCMSENIIVRMVAGFLGSFLFLPLVAMGMHHGLVALYSVQLETIGFVTLYPALAMAGAGQVGAAIAIWLKAKRTGNKRMMSVIGGALPAGVLGVGEPLIYGVTLPMGKPFITAGLGAGFGGMFCMAMKVAATTWGPSGILALPIMVAGGDNPVFQMACYAIGLVISYIMGFIFTYFTLKDDEVAVA